MTSAMDLQVFTLKYYFTDLENSPEKLWLRLQTEIEIPLWLQNHLLWSIGLFRGKIYQFFFFISLSVKLQLKIIFKVKLLLNPNAY